MERDWVRLGEELAAARGARTQQHMADVLGVSRSSVQKIEAGQVYKKVQPVHRAYAREVGWSEDSVEAVLAGDAPTLAPAGTQESPSEPAPEPSDLSLRVRQALLEGPLLDNQIITVPTPGGDVRATLVVRGSPEATPEELHQALLAWQRHASTRAIERLDDGDGAQDTDH